MPVITRIGNGLDVFQVFQEPFGYNSRAHCAPLSTHVNEVTLQHVAKDTVRFITTATKPNTSPPQPQLVNRVVCNEGTEGTGEPNNTCTCTLRVRQQLGQTRSRETVVKMGSPPTRVKQ